MTLFYGLEVAKPPLLFMHTCDQITCNELADYRFTLFTDGNEVAAIDLCTGHALNNGVTGLALEMLEENEQTKQFPGKPQQELTGEREKQIS